MLGSAREGVPVVVEVGDGAADAFGFAAHAFRVNFQHFVGAVRDALAALLRRAFTPLVVERTASAPEADDDRRFSARLASDTAMPALSSVSRSTSSVDSTSASVACFCSRCAITTPSMRARTWLIESTIRSSESATCEVFWRPDSTASLPRRVTDTARLVSSHCTVRMSWTRFLSSRPRSCRRAFCEFRSATTRWKPRPCSPARAASIAALSASKFVWSAISSIFSVIEPILQRTHPQKVSIVLTNSSITPAASSEQYDRREGIAAEAASALSPDLRRRNF